MGQAHARDNKKMRLEVKTDIYTYLSGKYRASVNIKEQQKQ
jgi:hypothetical protein